MNKKENIKIEKANRDNLYDIAAFLDKSWRAEYRKIISDDYLDEMKTEDRYQRLLRRFDDGRSDFLVMFSDKKMIGVSVFGKSFIDGYQNDGEISAIYLESNYIGKGYGYLLFTKIEETMSEKNYEYFVLDVLTDNVRALEFYIKQGYEKVEDRSIKLGKNDYPLTVMRKKNIINSKTDN